MLSEFEGIFKHIGLKAMTQLSMECHGIQILKKLKISETHETLIDLMSCHQDDVVKKLVCLTKVCTHTPHKPEQLTRRLVVLRGNNACLMTNGR